MQTAAPARPSLREFAGRRYAGRGPLFGWLLFEPVGGVIAYVLSGVPAVTPSMVTLLGGCLGIAGAAVLAVAGSWGGVVLAAVLLCLAYALDCADGQLARATGRTSARGAWLDVVTDATVFAFLTAALGSALSTGDGGTRWDFLIAGAFGASRLAGLFTWTSVRDDKAGSLQLSALGSALRAAYGSVIDTPFVYLLLCLTRLSPTGLRVALLAVAVLTVGQLLVAARRHLAAAG